MKDTAFDILKNMFLIITGTFICTVAINGILIPHHFVSSGITGLGIVIHYLASSSNLSVVLLMLNIPIFIAAFVFVRKRFFFLQSFRSVLFYIGGQFCEDRNRCPG